MIQIVMLGTELSNEDAGKWMADILDKYPHINIGFRANAFQFEEVKKIMEERAVISKAMGELVKNLEVLETKLNSASDNQLDKLGEIQKDIEELYTGIQFVKFNKYQVN